MLRGLFELSGGTVLRQQHDDDELDLDFAAGRNASLCGLAFGVSGSGHFGQFDPRQMHSVLAKSKVFLNNNHAAILDTSTWSWRILAYVPIGLPKDHLVRKCDVSSW